MPIIHELLRVWREKYPHNLIRGAYYDCKERFKDFGISIPDQIKNKVEAMIGWPELASDHDDLSDLEGSAYPATTRWASTTCSRTTNWTWPRQN